MELSRSHVVYRKAAAVKDGLVSLACSAGLVTDPQTIELDGNRAKFRVTTAAERWRVRQQMRETEVLRELLGEVRIGDCFWDVGSAVGTYSCLAADAGADPIAFEPHPKNHNRCVENFDLNGLDAPVHRLALSDRSEAMQLSTDGAVGTGTFQLSKSGDIEVETVRGDEVDAPAPDVIKVDVEGHELRVLQGMGRVLEVARVIFVECHPHHGVDVDQVREFLNKRGFVVETIALNRGEPYVVGRQSETGDT